MRTPSDFDVAMALNLLDVDRLIRDTVKESEYRARGISESALSTGLGGLVPSIGEEIRNELLELHAAYTTWTAVREATRRRLRPVRVLVALAGMAVVAIAAIVIGGAFGLRWLPLQHRIGGWWRAGLFVLDCLFLVALRSAVYVIRREQAIRSAPEERAFRTRSDSVTEVARHQFAKAARELTNQYLRNAREALAVLRTKEAPALVELDAGEAVPATSMAAVKRFIAAHNSSAIGLAGPRGVGKSTIIRHVVRTDGTRVGAYIQAPVRYDAGALVRLIHGEVARAILDTEAADTFRSERPLVVGYMPAAISAYAGVGLITLGIIGFPRALTGTEATFVSVGVCLVSMAGWLVYRPMFERQRRRRAMQKPSDAGGLARDALEALGFSRQLQEATKAGVSLAKTATFESSAQVSMAERELTHPERVAAFAAFVREYENHYRGQPIVIGIDELDKLASGDEAIEMVNGLKDLFHIRNTHFVVSVSEDALDRFAARGVPLRDAFDSAFDAVLQVDRMSFRESFGLLNGRVVDFPESAALFCHAWAGGLARDVIRAARSCVDVRRLSGAEGVPLSDAVRQVVTSDVLAVLQSAVNRARMAESPFVLERVLQLRRLVVAEGAGVRLARFLEDMPAVPSTPDPFAASLVPYLHIAVVTSDFFGRLRSSAAWREGLDDGTLVHAGESLALAVAALAVSPQEALFRLDVARQQFATAT